jgi:hypothetical protein
MPSRREERERLRAERLAAQSHRGSSERRRLILGYAVAGILTLAVVAGLVAVIASGGDGDGAGGDLCDEAHVSPDFGSFTGLEPDCREGTGPPELQQGDPAAAAEAAGCTLRENLRNEGQTHVDNSADVRYRTDPPTSGNHNPNPVADGAFATPVRYEAEGAGDEMTIRNLVHSLEHGRIQIQYKSSLPEDDQLALKGIFDADPAGMLMFPNDEMPFEVAATAWTQLLGCPTFNEAVLDAVQVFRDVYRGRGPENVAMVAP